MCAKSGRVTVVCVEGITHDPFPLKGALPVQMPRVSLTAECLACTSNETRPTYSLKYTDEETVTRKHGISHLSQFSALGL